MQIGKTMKDANVVQKIAFDTASGDASNFSAKIAAFTATGIHDKIKNTDAKIPSMLRMKRAKNATIGAIKVRIINPR